MATPYYDDPNARGYDSGVGQLMRARARNLENKAVTENPVGPPALVRPPPVNNAVGAGVRVNPTPTDLATEGALRPAAGAFSAANPQPAVDAVGNLTPPAPIARPNAAPVPTNPAARAATEIAAAAPVLATVTPATAANANDLALARPGAVRGGGNTTAPQATSINGRPLGYGAEVNGVRVFSDGSGGAGAPPATMTKDQIANLANGDRISVADSGVGGNVQGEAFRGVARPGGAASSVLANTPELGSAAGLALARPAPAAAPVDGYARARADFNDARRNAASDMASIFTEDPRSPLGAAARTARLRLNDTGSGGGRRERAETYRKSIAAIAGASDAGALDGTTRIAEAGVRDAGESARANLDAATRIATTGMDNQGQLQRALVNRPAPAQVNLSDGTLGLVGPDGVVRPALDSRTGTPARPEQTRKQVDQAAYSKMVGENINRLLGVDPISGKRADGTAPSAEDLFKATTAATALTDEAFGISRGTNAAGAPASSGAPADAVEFLRQNPQYRADFDKKYGAGAAARALGTGA